MKDTLGELLEQQYELQRKLGYDIFKLTTEERTAYIKEYVLHLENEVHEMLHELPHFKPWKNYDKEEDNITAFNKARQEWIDALHFFLNISLALGFNSSSMCKLYKTKNEINHLRQNSPEYKKCEED